MLSTDDSIAEVLDGGFYVDDPWSRYAWLREHSPSHWDEINELWVVTRYEDIVTIEKDKATFIKSDQLKGEYRPNIPADASMIGTDDPLHSARRNLISRRFTPRAVMKWEHHVRETVDSLIDPAVAQIAALVGDNHHLGRRPPLLRPGRRCHVGMNRRRKKLAGEVEIHGQVISAGQQVILMYAGANRDPAQFDEPDRFDITRRPNNHLSFGFGTHFCLGASLVRLEIRTFFERLVAGIDSIARLTDRPHTEMPNAFVYGLRESHVSLTPAR